MLVVLAVGGLVLFFMAVTILVMRAASTIVDDVIE